ncbi:MAG TPA: SRPBCC family protein [Actinomycetota bacterium]|nr:SRPBCC family protein [Actinomycetota bacterium]
MTKTIEESIDVQVPVQTAYNQWTQFEEFPRFMEGVEEVRQMDDTRLYWVAEVAGQRREWEAKITEQEPDQRIAWTAAGDVVHAGVVSFHRLDDATTRVMLQMELEPESWVDKAADALGITTSRIRGDLERFKEFIESRGQETGSWRGEVEPPGQVTQTDQ